MLTVNDDSYNSDSYNSFKNFITSASFFFLTGSPAAFHVNFLSFCYFD